MTLNKRLPKISVIATGGTIAGSSADATDTVTYQVGNITLDTLIRAVPQLEEVAELSGEQVANIPSSDIDNATLFKLADRVNQCIADPDTDGVVITHGTDTLEETAFFLELTTHCYNKPVVLVGAMRPATALSSDGPFNLLQAVTLAASQSAVGRGVLIVLNDRIGSAYYTTKTNTTAVDTFKATEQGYLGAFLGTKPHFYYSAAVPTGRIQFDLSQVDKLPKVPIVYIHSGQDTEQVDCLTERGAKGIVLAGTGAGSVPSTMKTCLTKLDEQGIPVIRASRTGGGFAVKEDDGGIAAGILNPQKARILLMLALATGADITRIKQYFSIQ